MAKASLVPVATERDGSRTSAGRDVLTVDRDRHAPLARSHPGLLKSPRIPSDQVIHTDAQSFGECGKSPGRPSAPPGLDLRKIDRVDAGGFGQFLDYPAFPAKVRRR